MTGRRALVVALALAGGALAALVWARSVAPGGAPLGPAACVSGTPFPQFCPSLPSFPPAQSGAPTILQDQIQPCGATATFRPSFCVSLPAPGQAPDRAALIAQREEACGRLARAEAPEFCFVVPSGGTTEATLGRQAALALLRQRLGSDFRRVSGGTLDLWAENDVPSADGARVEAILREDVAFVEATFGRRFREVPAVFLFSSQRSFARALEQQFGYDAAVASQLAGQYGGILVGGVEAIAINGQNVLGGDRPTIFRHELAHVMAHQLAGVALPFWFDEGLAALVAAPEPSSFDVGRATALSILADDALRSVAFDETRSWPDRNTTLGGNAYRVAAEAVRLLQEQLGATVLTALLEAAAREGSFASAFAGAVGEPAARFVADAPDRATRACRAGIGRSATRADGLVVWWIHGFGPRQQVTVTAEGPARYAFTVATDRFGVYSGTLGAPMPAGEYAVRARQGASAVELGVTIGTPAAAGRACG